MNQFLQTSKTIINDLNYPEIFVVLGNESCDLDSVVSPLIYAYFLHKKSNISGVIRPVLPVLNIRDDEFPLRTESKYFLGKLNISTKNLIFRNQIDLSQLNIENKLKLVLVDHHVLPHQDKNLENSVVEIIDHRPKDPNSNWKNVDITINTVGSCATLIANKIFNNPAENNCIDEEIAKLLHGTIILDTVNFNVNANRFTSLDVEMARKLENDYKIPYTRDEIFNELTNARSDTSTLTPLQILHRDMKIINGVPIPGCPMLIRDFLRLTGAKDALNDFCATKKCKVIVLMGLVTRNEQVFRDLGVYSLHDCNLKNELIRRLIETKDLELNEVRSDVSGLTLFSQGNVKMSRKHVVPILSPVIVASTCDNVL